MKKVEFDAHKKVRLPVPVKFRTSSGKKVGFVAKKQVRVPVHVEFRTER